MNKIARLTPVPLRELWKHEAQDFTRWLADHLDYLEEVTGLSLTLEGTEVKVGEFVLDISATDGEGNPVVIECQLEKTDHNHLGKLVTYLSNMDAKTAIWITSEARDEHERAIDWLNEISPDDTAFYLIQVEAYRIEDSPPAPKFTIIAGPDEQRRQFGVQRKEMAERHVLRQEFWENLLERLREKKVILHSNIKPGKQNWLGTGAGRAGLSYNYVILMDEGRVELYINTNDGETNKRYFAELYKHKEAIEKEFGGPLEWQRLDEQRASRIAYRITEQGGLKDRESWPRLQEAMIDAMVRLEKALSPYMKKLE